MAGNSYYYRKIHSLLGVIPVGFFLIEHFISNYSAFHGGPEKFAETVEWITGLPFLFFLELFFIWLPLLYHGVYGLYVAYQSKNNVSNFGYLRNHLFMWQRITGVITFVFVILHVFDTRVQVALGNITYDELGSRMHEILTNPVYFVIYCIGVVAASFHFCNGMWNFLVSWGITVGPRAQHVSTYVWLIAFVAMSAVGILALTGFLNPEFQAYQG